MKQSSVVTLLSTLVFILSLSTLVLFVDKIVPHVSPLSGTGSVKSEILNTIDTYYINSTEDIDYHEGELQGLVAALEDPYTEYLSKEDYENFTEALNEEYVGIGIRFSNTVEGFLVEEVMPGSPAQEARVQVGDYIFKIEDTLASEIPFEDVAGRIRGQSGTKVSITFLRSGAEINTTITRRPIEIEQLQLDIQDTIATIIISSFGEDLDNKMLAISRTIEEENITDIVLDLRSNGGGLLNEAVDVASYFLETGDTIMIEKTKTEEKTFTAKDKAATLQDKNIVVLVNRYSASASEILAGALRDNNQVTIVGERTFGKGVVQRVFPLSNGSVLKLTIAEWFTPNGEALHNVGLEPDILSKPGEDILELGRSQFN